MKGKGAAAKANGSNRHRAESDGAPAELAGFVAEELKAIDAPMWPVHQLFWMQPDVQPAAPSSGLRIERRHKIPVPGFVGLEPAAIRGVPAREELRNRRAIASEIPVAIHYSAPESGLALLGWDPRTERRDAF